MRTDVVCGMQVDESTNELMTEFDGQKYYFCSAGCKAEFYRHRDEYVSEKRQGEAPTQVEENV